MAWNKKSCFFENDKTIESALLSLNSKVNVMMREFIQANKR